MHVARPEPPHRRAARTGARSELPAFRVCRAWAGPLAALMIALATVVPGPVVAAATWSRNLYVAGAFLYQDPYYTACTAASTMTMLNTIAARGTGGPGFAWTAYRVKHNATNPDDRRDMTSILAFARARDTLRSTSAGTDAHGWRNALNYHGWGEAAMTDPARMVYMDRAYRGFKGAVKAAVRAIARFGMPVGILGWAGGHAQVMTGYVVTGQDPRVSSDFEVRYVYLSDPLRKNDVVNKRISIDRFRYGPLKYRFQAYREADSPYDDPYTPEAIRSSVRPTTAPSEWYRRWVIVVPVRSGLPPEAPEPVPSPGDSPGVTPEPAPPDASPTPDVTPPESPTSEPAPTSAPTSEPTPTPAADPTPDADPTPPPEPTATPSTEPPDPGAPPG